MTSTDNQTQILIWSLKSRILDVNRNKAIKNMYVELNYLFIVECRIKFDLEFRIKF